MRGGYQGGGVGTRSVDAYIGATQELYRDYIGVIWGIYEGSIGVI